jgi:hypothetical protein
LLFLFPCRAGRYQFQQREKSEGRKRRYGESDFSEVVISVFSDISKPGVMPGFVFLGGIMELPELNRASSENKR